MSSEKPFSPKWLASTSFRDLGLRELRTISDFASFFLSLSSFVLLVFSSHPFFCLASLNPLGQTKKPAWKNKTPEERFKG